MHKLICLSLSAFLILAAQQKPGRDAAKSTAPAVADKTSGKSIIGPDDILQIEVLHGEELSRTWRVNAEGEIRLPFVGMIKAGGMTVDELEITLTDKLAKYFNDPQVSVRLSEARSKPVTVMGNVERPGTLQLEGRNTLFHVLNAAGGPKDAGASLTVTREVSNGPLPVDEARTTQDGRYMVAEVPLEDVLSGRGQAATLEVQANDVITVSARQPRLVHVMGEVVRPGSVELVNAETVSITKVVAAAGGFNRLASPKKAVIRKIGSDGKPGEMATINLKQILDGKSADLELTEGDVLIIPSNQFMSYLQAISMTAVNAGVFSGFQVLARY
jgi:polysaccharide export outer membrane protein